MHNKINNINLDLEKLKYPLISSGYGWFYETVIHDVPQDYMTIVFWGKDQKNKILHRYIRIDTSCFKKYFDFSVHDKNITTSGLETIEQQFMGVLSWSDEARDKLHHIALIAAQLFDFLEYSRSDWSLEYDILQPNLETVLTADSFEKFLTDPISFYHDAQRKSLSKPSQELCTE